MGSAEFNFEVITCLIKKMYIDYTLLYKKKKKILA